MKGKLQEAAKAGWTGRHAPWQRARGYLYCIAGRFPNADARHNLRKDIREFFDNLPEGERLAIEWVEVLDWPNLRTEFDSIARLRDEWLGVDHSALQSQASYEASLVGFRGFLLEGTLPYIPPVEAAPSHPQEVFRRLDELAKVQRGVLLAGAGGVGKTRTALEVARLAAQAGWRVLHATGTDGLKLEELEKAVLPSAHRTSVLLCLDYLEQFVGLDPNALRGRLAGGVAERDGRLAVLATARLSAAEQHGNRWTGFFDRVELQPDEAQRARIIRSMVPVAAPEACRRYGEDAILGAVGQRPIIALLIARAIESLHHEAGTDGIGPLLAAARVGQYDLKTWLESRLREDRLLPVENVASARFADDPMPIEQSLVAAAAALAALPLVNWKVTEVAAKALPDGADTTRAAAICQRLLRFGWTDERDNFVQSAHDVVADEVLAGCVFDKASGAVRPQELQRILAADLSMPRVLGRHAVALTRAFQGSTAEGPIAEAFAAWLRPNAVTLGMALADAPPDEGGYAIGALLGTPLAAATALELSRALFGPWLVRHGLRREAYHVLGRALRRPEPGDNVIRLGFGWLERYGTTPEASHVLPPLLGRADLGTADAAKAIKAAFTWLDHAAYGTTPEASHVLPPLLGRHELSKHELSKEDTEDALDLAILWLRHEANATTTDASHVLKVMLRYGATLRERESVVLGYAARWTRVHWRRPDADFVMNRCLRRPTTPLADWRASAARALLRLRRGRAAEAAYAIAALLARARELRPSTQHLLLREFLRIAGEPSNRAVYLPKEARFALSRWLALTARCPDGDSCALAAEVCSYLNTRWPEDPAHLRVISHFLSPALAIAARCGDAEVMARCQDLTLRWLHGMDGDAAATRDFAQAAWGLVAAGAWPDATAACKVLETLGIADPAPSDGAE